MEDAGGVRLGIQSALCTLLSHKHLHSAFCKILRSPVLMIEQLMYFRVMNVITNVIIILSAVKRKDGT